MFYHLGLFRRRLLHENRKGKKRGEKLLGKGGGEKHVHQGRSNQGLVRQRPMESSTGYVVSRGTRKV